MERIGGEIDLLQFESLVPLLKKLENAQEITLDYSDTDFRENNFLTQIRYHRPFEKNRVVQYVC
jgi:hypothetical protein